MDVKKKLALLEVTDSYWDMLPEQVQMYIVKLKIKQEYLDQLKREQWKKVFKEIEQYGKLKETWALGPIRFDRCNCGYGNVIGIWGYFPDECNVERKRYLGIDFKQALERVNHVKSFL